MYVRAVVNEVLTETSVARDLTRLPQGLNGFYERHWEQILAKASGSTLPERLLHPTLCVLSVADQPLTLHELLAVLGEGFPELASAGTGAVQAALNLWGQFLVSEPGPNGDRYQIYHKSFREFLMRKPSVSSELQMRKASDWLASAILKAARGEN
jgi:hypothetical protein